MRGETNRPAQYYTSSDWVNRKEIMLSGWPINKKANHVGRKQAGGINRAKGLIRRLEQEGKL